ncbi:lipoate-protein ligase 1 [Plasmodium brasilianum]|uniref:lipoate--protein ligase n=2 Tax=Plasmodium (Plasmodium) TaxID=418103 RepID=A0A1A8WBN4_PLAMA|nr:lipoate-protein ligase 1, putative [Plasmodium malariae]KAI4834708.1 lipoate-protein ligase 1 [Plasmodium brasilianum]SBS90265.1 lipoate-protein ligase [Plasmodium malariae]SCP03259.1 lipoate-protein ligase 1, putative [Plasmodium malariae]
MKGIFSSLRRWYSSGKKKKRANPVILISNNRNIHFNLSLEIFLLNNYNDLLKYLNVNTIEKFNEPVLFLWRNNKSIIIGKNQNIWSECDLKNIKKDDVLVARRFTGGGAVYHDLGNVCFTFLNNNVNTSNNFSIIVNTLKNHFNINAKIQGRNDITVNNLKCSGSAFKKVRGVFLHHGTILVNLEKNVLSKYLTPDKMKYLKHGVNSVSARTVNLKEINENITCENLSIALIKEFNAFYGNYCNEKNSNQNGQNYDYYWEKGEKTDKDMQEKSHLISNKAKDSITVEIKENNVDENMRNDSSIQVSKDNIYNLINSSFITPNNFNIHYIDTNDNITKNPEFLKYYNLLKDWDWCYGKTPKFQNKLCKQFNFGKVEICFNVYNGVIKDGNIFSDSLDVNLIDQLKSIFNKDIKYSKENINIFLQNLQVENKDSLAEITPWILQEL